MIGFASSAVLSSVLLNARTKEYAVNASTIDRYRVDAGLGRLIAVLLANTRRAFELAGTPFVNGAAAQL